MPLDFLRSDFEAQIEATIDEEGEVHVGDTSFTPASLLLTDKEAYEGGFRSWHEYWLGEQLERLDEILCLGANRKRFEDLRALDRVIPLVGSGLSVPSGLPTWSEFLLNICKDSDLSESELSIMLDAGAYEEAAEALQNGMPKQLFDERIEHELRLLSGREVTGAVRLFPSAFGEVVLTTNLDNVIEQVYEDQSLPFASIVMGTAIGTYRERGEAEMPCLLKLHGGNTSPVGRVITRSEYDAAYSPDTLTREEIRRLCRTSALLCIGCSLRADRTVELLRDVVNPDNDRLRHYAFLEMPDGEDAARKRQHFLVERNIFPIWYAGDHDESVQALLAGMLVYRGVMP